MKTAQFIPTQKTKPKLELVLKCDSVGSLEAVTAAIEEIISQEFDITIIRSGVGPVGQSDVLFAETAGRLIAGFQVGVTPGLEKTLKQHNVEVRLYNVIYQLTTDITAIAESIIPKIAPELVIGSAKVIALFKSSRKGIIAGCEVMEGFLALNERFRIISAMGPVYSGIIESLHMGESVVQKAIRGQQVGIKIKGFNKVRIGDIVESFRLLHLKQQTRRWEPTGSIIKK